MESQISIGFTNDGRDIYVCLAVTDPYKRSRIIANGLVVWIDPKGGQGKAFGLKFPLGMTEESLAGRPDRMPGLWTDEGMSAEVPSDSWTELEVIVPGNEMPLKMKVEEARGLEVKASRDRIFVF